jgi:meiosis induction protein kinase IME2/SME1
MAGRHSGSSGQRSSGAFALEDMYEILKDDIGDGSFGSVALARVRSAGAHVARRGTTVSLTR